MKILCEKQRRAVRYHLYWALYHLKHASSLTKGAYGSSNLRRFYIESTRKPLAKLLDESGVPYGTGPGSLLDLKPPMTRKRMRMDAMPIRDLGLTVPEASE